MAASQKFIANIKYNICVDGIDHGDTSGRVYCSYNKDLIITFATLVELVNKLEEVMDELKYPHKTTGKRTFNKTEKVISVRRLENKMDDNNIESKRGEKATFVVEIKYRENSTWQGTVKWIEGNKEENFRSALELIRLIDSTEEKR